jgi:L-amino acid N-acyltransferase YncA
MIQNTLFAKYLSEREGKRIIEDERGFIIYKIQGEECFLAEGFIQVESRGSSAASDLLRNLIATAKAEGCKTVTATIYLSDPGAMRTLAAALKRGFRVYSANHDVLLIAKEI